MVVPCCRSALALRQRSASAELLDDFQNSKTTAMLSKSSLRLIYGCSMLIQLAAAAPAPQATTVATDNSHESGLAASCTGQSSKSCGLLAGQTATTVITTKIDGSTRLETYVATSLPAFQKLTTQTTVTTTDTAGETVVAVVFAAGLAWLAAPKPGTPPLDPPQDPPTITQPPEHSSASVTSSQNPSTSKATTSSLPPQPQLVSLPDPNWQQLFKDPLVSYSSNNIGYGFKGDKDTPAISRDVLSSKIRTFCSEKNGIVANQTIPTNHYFNIGSGKVVNITVSQFPLCAGKNPDESKIWEDDCNFFLHEALDSCDTKTLDKHGGIVNDACLNWELRSHLNDGELTCGKPVKDGTGFNRDEAMSNIQKFCQGNAGKKISRKSSQKQTFKPRLGNSNMEISATMSDDQACDPDKEADYTIDGAACQRFLFRAVDECDTNFKGYLGKYGGSVKDACGVFSFTTSVEEVVRCGGSKALYPDSPPANLTSAAAEGGIKKYCEDSFILDPNYKPDNDFHQFGAPGTSKDSYPADGVAARMWTLFDNELTTGCAENIKFDTKGDECRRKLGVVKDQCGEQGGVLSSNNLDGCTVWTLYGTEA